MTLAELHDFNVTVFQTIHLALSNPDAAADILAAIATVTAAVAGGGADPIADINALKSINQIVTNLATARQQVQG